ncbi:MAG TPA: pitrilysin family protein [Polyangia bacterium]|jgi:predicted Zn-dependent peptidase
MSLLWSDRRPVSESRRWARSWPVAGAGALALFSLTFFSFGPVRAGQAAGPTAATGASAPLPELRFEKYVLPNGLEVILHEDHRVPQVVVDVWFKVGSKDEELGRTGFAHLFEHVMFQGSKHVGEDKHFAYLQKAGVSNANGSTSEDRTNYFEQLPSNQLELALWLESDRMGFLLERAGLQETFDGQRDVVKNERRQRIENRPMGLVNRVTIEALFPPSHPYHHEVIGSMEDLSRASLDDVKSFFHRFYAPNNATLVLAGDFDPAHARTLIEQYFAPIPAGAPIARTLPPAVALRAETRINLEAKVQQPQVFIDYPTPRSLSEGDHALDVVAQVLAGGKASRLYKRLVYDLQIAQSVTASQQSQMLQSVFEISATPLAGHTIDELVRVIDEEIEGMRAKPVEPRELERAKNQIEFDQLRSLEPLLAQAERLQIYNLQAGDPGYLARDLESYRNVDAAAVQGAVAQYLRKDGRVVVTVTPNPDAPIMGRVKP